MSDMDDMAAQQVLVSIGTCQWPVTSFWLLLEQPLRNHALLPTSVETAWQKVVLIRLDLHLHLIFIITVCPISTFIICHPSQSLYTPSRSIRHPTPTPADRLQARSAAMKTTAKRSAQSLEFGVAS